MVLEQAERDRLKGPPSWTLLTPVVGIALAVGLLEERPSGWTGMGLTATLVSMWVAVRARARH